MDELIQKKELFIESASSFFDRYSNATESLILDTLYTIIDALQGEGTIAKNAANRKKINEVNRVIFDALKQSKFSSEVRNFIKNFDTVEEFQKNILKEVNPDLTFDKLKFNDQKKELANEIIKGVTNKEMLENQIAKPLKKIMQEHVSKGITFKQAREEIRSYILKDENKRGLIGSRVNFLARESLLRFDGSINQKVATEFDLDAFRIVGSLIKTSEPSCREMIRGTGRFSGMMTNGKYAIKDIPVIIDKIRNDKAFVPGTNEKNYFTNRNHYGCRHTFIPTKFLKRDLEGQNIEDVVTEDKVPEFKVSKNIAEAEKYAKELGMQTVEFKGLHIDTVNDINKSIFKLKSVMPEIRTNGVGSAQAVNTKVKKDLSEWIKNTNWYDKIKNNFGEKQAEYTAKKYIDRQVSKVGSGTIAWSSGRDKITLPSGEAFDMTKYSGVYVNNTYGKDYQKVVQVVEAGEKSGWFTKNAKGFEYIMNHEIGHEIDATIGFRNSKTFLDIYNREHAKGINHVIENLSKYGATAGGNARHKPHEMIAESWAEFIGSESPRPLAKEVGEAMLKEYYENYIKNSNVEYSSWKSKILKIAKQ